MPAMEYQRSLAGVAAVWIAAGALLGAALAAEVRSPTVQVDSAWARATVAGQRAGGGYVRIENRAATADRLISARSPAAERVEIHAMSMEGDVMRMRQIDGIDLPAGGMVELKPGGFHLMFMELKAPLQAGTRFPLTLRFEKAGELAVTVAVETPGAPASVPRPDAHRH